MAPPVLLKNLSKRFSSPHNPQESCLVVDRINLELKEGELLTLVGPRGCGKSTILKMIAGLERPTGGEIYVDGHRVEGGSPTARDVGILVTGSELFEHMSVADNISFGFSVRKITSKDRRRRFERLVALLGLEDFLNHSPNQISRGQQRRVALARVLAPQPRVLLLDDPFAGLDPVSRQLLRTETKLWQRELNIPTIFATHDRFEALEMGERIAILEDGRFQQVDTYRNLFDYPANSFVASYMGREFIYTGAPYSVLDPATGVVDAELPNPTSTPLAQPIFGQKIDERGEGEDGVHGYPEAGNTFLGCPVRFEVRRND